MSTRNIIIALVVIGAIVALVVGYRRQRAVRAATAEATPIGGSTIEEPVPTQVVEAEPTELQKMRYAASDTVRGTAMVN